MSYNTRRTGAGRGSPTTQVNYHQQRPRGNSTGDGRNSNYTSSQQSNYISTSQPSYLTQGGGAGGGHSTQSPPPLPKTPQPSSNPAPPQAMPAPTLPPTPTPTPTLVKQEPTTPLDTPKADTTENGEVPPTKQPFWKKKSFTKVSNRIKKARQNAKLRRLLNPKNALTFLNELKPGGVKFVVREEAGWGGYVASVEIDGKTFSGHGMTVSKGKVQASEQALKYLLLEKLSKTQSAPTPSTDTKDAPKEDDESMDTEETSEGDEPKSRKNKMDTPEEELPWGSLAAFALHKLFAEWQKEGMEVQQSPQQQHLPPPPPPSEKYEEECGDEQFFTRRPGPPPDYGFPRRPPPPGAFGRGRGFAPPQFHPRGPPPPGFGMPRRLPPAAFPPGPPGPNESRAAFPLGRPVPQPMKKIPDDATKRHPVMLLNQLKPNLVYNETREGEPPNAFFKITIQLDGKDYEGRGKSKKDAKKQAAIAALAPLGIQYEENE